MRLWAENDVTTLMGLRQVEGPSSAIIEAAIKREIVHPIELPDESVPDGMRHFLSTGELPPERKAQIEDEAVAAAVADVAEDYEVRNAEIEGVLRTLGKTIDDALPDGFGFALLLYEFGDKGGMFYISNGQRSQMIEAMAEFLEVQRRKGH